MRILFVGSDHMDDRLGLEGHECAFFDGFDEERCPAGDLRVFASFQSALDEFRPELAVVGVPNTRKNRPEYEEALLRAGIPVLEQKFRLNALSDYERIDRAAEATGTALYVGEFYRLDPRTAAAREWIPALGEIEYLRWECRIGGDVHPWESAYSDLALSDLAYHQFSVMDALIGIDPARVYARSLSPGKGLPATGTVCLVCLDTKRGATVVHTLDWHNSLEPTDYYGDFHIEGSRGGLCRKGDVLTLTRWAGGSERRSLAGMAQPTALGRLLSGGEPPVRAEAFRPVMRALNAALTSVSTGLPVTLDAR